MTNIVPLSTAEPDARDHSPCPDHEPLRVVQAQLELGGGASTGAELAWNQRPSRGQVGGCEGPAQQVGDPEQFRR